MRQKHFPIIIDEKLLLALEQYKKENDFHTFEDAIWDLLNQGTRSTEEIWDPNIPDFIKEKISQIPNLNNREKIILGLRFGLEGQKPRTLESIGKNLGLTRERVRQIINRTLEQNYPNSTVISALSIDNPFKGEKNIVQQVEKILLFKNNILKIIANELKIPEESIFNDEEALGIASYIMKDIVGLSIITLSELFGVSSKEIIQAYGKLNEKLNYDSDSFQKIKRVINSLNSNFKEVGSEELTPGISQIKNELEAVATFNEQDNKNLLAEDSLELTILSKRAKNALKRNRIYFEKELVVLTREDLLKMPLLGEKTIEEILEYIKFSRYAG